jgi:parallel beta helix pectate lyase-like protein/uncharacterized protein DUF1565
MIVPMGGAPPARTVARASSVFAVSLGIACTSRLDTTLPMHEGTKAQIIADDQGRDIEAFEGTFPYDRIVASNGFILLSYSSALRDLQIAEGPVKLVAPGSPLGQRPIPRFDFGDVATIDGGRVAWRSITELPKALANRRIEGLDLSECAEEGGCLPEEDADPPTLCLHPCPPVEDPAPPLAAKDAAPPVAPRFRPCPSGWAETELEGLSACDPIPAGTGACAIDQLSIPGAGAACVAIGPPCPAGDYASDLPEGRPTLYVKQGAPAGGTGTAAAPFATIARALSAARQGAVIAVSKGTFEEAISLADPARNGIAIWGACAKASIIGGGLSVEAGVVAEVHSISIFGPNGSVLAKEGAGLDLDRVIVDGSGAAEAVAAESGAAITGANISIRAASGAGIAVRGGAAASLDRVYLSGSGGEAVSALDAASRLSLTNAHLEDTGIGIEVASGARVDLAKALVERSRSAAIRADGMGSTARLTDVVVRDVGSDPASGLDGEGIKATLGSSVSATRLVIERARNFGAIAIDGGTKLALSDAILRDIREQEANQGEGDGITAEIDVELRLNRVLVTRAKKYGVRIAEAKTSATLRDLAVYGVEPQLADGGGGVGLIVEQGAHATGTRVRFEDNATGDITVRDSSTIASFDSIGIVSSATIGSDAGTMHRVLIDNGASASLGQITIASAIARAISIGRGASAQLADVHVKRTRATRESSIFTPDGLGLYVWSEGRADVDRALFEGDEGYGILAEVGGMVTATDLEIRGSGLGGIRSRNGASVVARRVLIEHVHGTGVWAPLNGRIEISDARIHRSDPSLSTGLCNLAQACSGAGVLVAGDSSIELDRFVLDQNGYGGIVIDFGGHAKLGDGAITGNEGAGAVILDPAFPVRTVLEHVVFSGQNPAIMTKGQ